MRTSVKDYIPALEKYVFQGHELHHIEGSLYRCNNLFVEIHASKPRTRDYFFEIRMHPSADMCLYVCGKEMLVFCLEPEFMRQLPLSKAKSGDYSVFTLIAEHPLNGEARLIYKKDGKDVNPIDITNWAVPLYEPLTAGA
ncbi:hypothetical protein [Paenibacillus flagellatus]|uniref:Uncharacterized protein n=1 Tax=Paenibacillus flagellatus TaxID=2211139 RepID=A0A2V5K933_9BACL|nr:hypothetical protein [Paenibacillus flagellatus]PYI50290.1 hypothetical protein DLM86_29915 [Paenibacillus flagellatus]